MTDQSNADAGDTGAQINQANNEHMIPKSRFDELNDKRKAAVQALEDIASGFIETIPDDMREMVPDLPPAEKIKWIQSAQKKGLFTKPKNGLDSKKPGDKPPIDFSNLSPQAIMAQGYKSK
jgi:hypothetical protein